MLTGFQQFSSINEAGTAAGTVPAPRIAPYLKKALDDLDSHNTNKDALILSLNKKVDTMCQAFADGLSDLVNNAVVPPPSNKPAKPASLPWFSHGIKGFVNKLTWGNHPGNPDWQHYEGLERYSKLKSMVSETVDKLIGETFNEAAVPITDVIHNYVAEFKKHLTAVIHQGLVGMMGIGHSFGRSNSDFINAHKKDLEDYTAKIKASTKPIEPVEPPPSQPEPEPVKPLEPTPEPPAPAEEPPIPPKPVNPIPTDEEMNKKRKRFLSSAGLSPDSDVYKGLPPEAKKREIEKAKQHVAEIESVFDYKTRKFKEPEKAIDIMSHYELDPSKAKDVRTLWPKAEHKPLAPPPPKPLGVKRFKEGVMPTLAEWTQVQADQLVEQILEDATPETKARYLKYRLQYGS